jgi:hypothetical protein
MKNSLKIFIAQHIFVKTNISPFLWKEITKKFKSAQFQQRPYRYVGENSPNLVTLVSQ